MFGLNKVMLVGNLGGDPEVKKTANQHNLTQFTLATSESWLDKETGERKEKTEWHRIVVWGKLAETCARHLAKGRQVFIEGRLQTRSWDTEQGQKRFMTEVVASQVLFLGRSPQASANYQQASANQTSANNNETGNYNNQNIKKEPGFQQGKSTELPF